LLVTVRCWARRNPRGAAVAGLILSLAGLLAGVSVLAVFLWIGKKEEERNAYLAEKERIVEARTRAEVEVRALLSLARHRLQMPTPGRREDVLAILKKMAGPLREMRASEMKTRLELEARSVFAASLGVFDVRLLQEEPLPNLFPSVWRVAQHPDGKSLVLGTRRGPVRWVEGQPLRLPRDSKPERPGPRLWYSPDGKYLAYAPAAGGLELWNESAARVVAELEPARSSRPILAVGFTPEMNQVRACRGDGQLQSWSLPGFDRGSSGKAPRADLTAAAYSSDGKLLAVGDAEGQVLLCAADGKRIRQLQAGTRVEALAWSADSTLVAAGTQSGNVQLWQADGVPLHAFAAFETGVSNILFDSAGRWLLAGRREGGLKMWAVSTGELLLRDLPAPWGLSRGGRLATASWDRVARYELEEPTIVRRLRGHSACLDRLAWSGDHRHLASLDTAFQVRVWDVSHGVSLGRFPLLPGPEYAGNNSIALDRGADHLAAAGRQQAFLWRVKEPAKPLRQWPLSPGLGNEVAATGKGTFLLLREEGPKWHTVAYELQADRVNPRVLGVVRPAVPGESGFIQARITPDGRYYTWVGPRQPRANRRAEVWDLRRLPGGARLKTKVPMPAREGDGENGASLSPDGRYLVVGVSAGWSLHDLSTTEAPSPLQTGVDLHFVPLSGWVSATHDVSPLRATGTLALRRGPTAADWLEFVNPDASKPTPSAFSGDGASLAFGSQSGTVTVVDIPALREAVGALDKQVLGR
jgi:WD40 repeat protein